MARLLIIALLCGVFMAPFAPPAAAQDDRAQTLADIRQELSVLYVEIQRLKRELSTTGAPGVQIGGETTLERLDAIEAALADLTAKTEALELRVDRIVRDGTNRIGDLEFRLVELEGGDVSKLGETTTLGGGEMPGAGGGGGSAPSGGDEGDAPELAVGEREDFERAKAAYEAGDYRAAADQLAAYVQDYPGGALGMDAYMLRGNALEALGETTDAARAYLNAFSGDPEGSRAPEALYLLGKMLGEMGKTPEACVTLGEVGARFPGTEPEAQARETMRQLGCN